MQPLIESASLPVAEVRPPGPPAEDRSSPHRRRLIVTAVLLLLLVIFVPPFINIGRFRRRIVRSISAGLGRPVEASAVELRLFPLPGFVLHNLTIAEDPAYGAEPVMTAETVTAILRPSTLWHRRVEIATLRLESPSVNLVRNAQGHWNFESLLRNSPVLHRRKGTISATPMPFPYVEASDARINFKFGAEKLPFSLEQANLAFWKESTHDWRVRIRARPVRTDLTVEDAGEIRGQGELRTGGMLMNASIRARLEWRRVQLGEISRLLHGQDDGWRGTVDWTAQAQGTLSDVSVVSDAGVDEFRRAEFIPSSEMDLAAHCEARYVRNNPQLDSIACNAPVDDGQLSLRGLFHVPLPGYDSTATSGSLRIALHRAPAGFFLDLLRHVHPGVAADASASGTVSGRADCNWPRWNTPQNCGGELRSTNLRLHLAHIGRPLALSPLLLTSPPDSVEESTVWKLAPMRVSLGASTPATVSGAIGATGSELRIIGPADLDELGKLAQSLRIPAISGEVQSIRGGAQLALMFESIWLPRSEPATMGAENVSPSSQTSSPGPEPSLWTGSLELHDAVLKLAALPLPVHLVSASVNLGPDGVEWTALHGTFAHTSFDGSIQWQTPCPAATSACARSFAFHTARLNTERLQTALRGDSSSLLGFIPPWSEGPPPLPEISGTLNADAITAGRISLKDVSMKLRLHGHGADLLAISGQIFGGRLSGLPGNAAADLPPSGVVADGGPGSVRWGDGAPVYTLRAQLQHVLPGRIAAVWDEQWGRGTAGLQVDLKTQGWSAAELARHASGRFSLNWENGSLMPTLEAPETTTASSQTALMIDRFHSWRAAGVIRDEQLVLESSRMIPRIDSPAFVHERKSPASGQSVTGTISFARTLDLEFQPSDLTLAGPLSKPAITIGGNRRSPSDGALDSEHSRPGR